MNNTAEQHDSGWLDALRAECRHSSQAKAGARLGVSGSTVNQVLKGVYNGDVQRIQGLVEGLLMNAVVDCPVLSEIPLNRCLENQRRPFAATSPTRVALYHACLACVNNRRKQT